jgi:hypothetical protein
MFSTARASPSTDFSKDLFDKEGQLLPQKTETRRRSTDAIDFSTQVFLTREAIERGGVKRCGWTDKQLQILGVPTPRRPKWKRALIGTIVPKSVYDLFLMHRSDFDGTPEHLKRIQAGLGDSPRIPHAPSSDT